MRASFKLTLKPKQISMVTITRRQRVKRIKTAKLHISNGAHLDITHHLVYTLKCVWCTARASAHTWTAIAILEMCKSKSKIASSIFYYRFAYNYRCKIGFFSFCLGAVVSLLGIISMFVYIFHWIRMCKGTCCCQWIYGCCFYHRKTTSAHGKN